ncbi:MAG: Alanine dehydrogenase 2 [Bacteroidota bacterium]|jgi:alanine dehydrogenase
MKFGIIKERKNPPDRRVVFSPSVLLRIQKSYPQATIKIESSDIRIYSDQDYIDAGFTVANDISDCDVFFGVKEVPIEYLISNKKYFFFSHTIKKQAHNQKLLRAILDKNITLFDHETIVDSQNKRLIGFGRYAGIVGAYNGFRAFGQKFELFNIPKAETLQHKEDLVLKLKRQVLPPIKIVLTGNGKVGMGAKEILDGMKIKQVSAQNFLTKTYTEPIFTQIDVLDYNRRIDGKTTENNQDFYKNPQDYISNFERFSETADIFIAGHFHGNNAPDILTNNMLKSAKCKIKIVADISCDVNGPIASTIRASTISDPFFGYLPTTNQEVAMSHPGAIVVMAVDNLPCELPKDASDGFGEMFLEHVIPAFYNNDDDYVLSRSKMTENGKLTTKFEYLTAFASAQNYLERSH